MFQMSLGPQDESTWFHACVLSIVVALEAFVRPDWIFELSITNRKYTTYDLIF